MPGDSSEPQSNFAKTWHYRPNVPLHVSPFFRWPLNPKAMFVWIRDRWFFLTENTIFLGVAIVCWVWLSPSLDTASVLAPGWVALIFIRNFVLVALVAGGLHWYFHGRRLQGDRLKYDPRPIGEGRVFAFRSQVRDNMFWTLTSGVIVWSSFEVLMLWLMGKGWVPVLTWADNPIWFVALIFLTPFWISFHFYWIHRWLHWPPLYRLAHSVHHRNTNVGPWSGISMHPVEHLLFFSSVLIHLVVAAHPVHVIFHLFHQALTGVTSHTGFEGLVIRDKNRLALGTFHHQMHHRYFECNYGNLEMPWDVWFGSFHDGTADSHEKMKARRRFGSAG